MSARILYGSDGGVGVRMSGRVVVIYRDVIDTFGVRWAF